MLDSVAPSASMSANATNAHEARFYETYIPQKDDIFKYMGTRDGQMELALFNSDECPLNDKFGPHQIVINLTFCGDWAGNTFPGGMGACVDLVNNNPGAFNEAFWDIPRLSVYV